MWLSDGSGDFTTVTMSAWNVYGYDIYPGDFDADGLTDIFRYRQSDGKRHLFLSDGDGTFSARDPQYTTSWDAGYLLAVVDFDGDGDDDIFMYDPDDAGRILKENDDGTGHFHEENAGGSNWPTGAVPFAGNFKTPSGIVDLGSYKASNGRVDTYESNGAGSFVRIRQDTFETDHGPHVGFFDGDFLTDLILYDADDTGAWISRYSNGSSAWTSGETGNWEASRTLGVGDYQLS